MNDIAYSTLIRHFILALLILVPLTAHPGAQQTLTIEEALGQSRNNAAYQAQLEQIQVLEAQMQQSKKRPNPSFEAEYETGALSGDGDDYLLSLLLVQTWERGGKRELRQEIARTQLEQAVLEAENALRVLTSEIRLTFLELLWSQKRVSLIEAQRERINGLLQLDLVRVEQGEIPTLNASQIQTELTTLDALKAQLETERWKTQYQFNLLIGSPADAEYTAVEGDMESIPLPDVTRALSFALSHRPDLQTLRAAVSQADLEVRLEQAATKKDWDIGVGYHRIVGGLDQEDFVPQGLIESASSVDNLLHLTLSVPLPLWDDNSGNVAAAAATKRVRERLLAQAESLITGQVLSAYQAHRLNQRTRELYQTELIPRLEENQQRLEAAYQLTGENLEGWIGIQQDYLAAAQQELEADFQVSQAVIELEAAVGGSLA
ncbi:MAG: TolC family protein, partial [Acidobacteriota bacterium]